MPIFGVKFENGIPRPAPSWKVYIISLESLTFCVSLFLMKVFSEHLLCAACARCEGPGNAPWQGGTRKTQFQ